MTDIKPDITPVVVTDLPDASPSDPLEALSWLGDTVEEIVEGLRARGIKGQPLEGDRCPIFHYLAQWFDPMFIFVCPSYIRTRDWKKEYDYEETLSTFIVNFDNRRFPDLIDNG